MQSIVVDFWQMIYQENTRIIIMLTNEVEKGKVTAHIDLSTLPVLANDIKLLHCSLSTVIALILFIDTIALSLLLFHYHTILSL